MTTTIYLLVSYPTDKALILTFNDIIADSFASGTQVHVQELVTTVGGVLALGQIIKEYDAVLLNLLSPGQQLELSFDGMETKKYPDETILKLKWLGTWVGRGALQVRVLTEQTNSWRKLNSHLWMIELITRK